MQTISTLSMSHAFMKPVKVFCQLFGILHLRQYISGCKMSFTDESEDRYKDVNTTAFNLLKGVINSLLEYTCSAENGACNKTSMGL